MLCHAQSKKWEYIPQAFKTPKIPSVLNPKLPLSIQVNLAKEYPLQEAVLARRVIAQRPPVYYPKFKQVSCPPQFISFLSWLDKIQEKHLVAPTTNTQRAVSELRQKIFQYEQLMPVEQAQVNFWIITLDQLRLKLGTPRPGYFYRLFYFGESFPDQMPKLDNMHLQLKKTGMEFSKMSQVLDLNLKTLYLAEDHQSKNLVKGFTFVPGATAKKSQEEFARAIKATLPAGYSVRMNVHELGIEHGKRDRFRKGYLHVHFEKLSVRTEVLPVDESIELWLSCKPFAGVVDPKTRKLIVSFDDKQIAENYLTVFGEYLSRDAKQTLQNIIYGKSSLKK